MARQRKTGEKKLKKERNKTKFCKMIHTCTQKYHNKRKCKRKRKHVTYKRNIIHRLPVRCKRKCISFPRILLTYG